MTHLPRPIAPFETQTIDADDAPQARPLSASILRMLGALAARVQNGGKGRRAQGAPWTRQGRSTRLDRKERSPARVVEMSDGELHASILGVTAHKRRGLSDHDVAVQWEWSVGRAVPWWLLRAMAPQAVLTPAEQALLGVERMGETAKRLAALVLWAWRRGFNGLSLSRRQAVAIGAATSHSSWWRAVGALQDRGIIARTTLWCRPRSGKTGAPVENARNHYAPRNPLVALAAQGKAETADMARPSFLRKVENAPSLDAPVAAVVAAAATRNVELAADAGAAVVARAASYVEAARGAGDRTPAEISAMLAHFLEGGDSREATTLHGGTTYRVAENKLEKEGHHSSPPRSEPCSVAPSPTAAQPPTPPAPQPHGSSRADGPSRAFGTASGGGYSQWLARWREATAMTAAPA